MPDESTAAGRTFAELEYAGWERAAGAYDDFVGKVTSGSVKPLLDAAGAVAGSRVLEVCCSPGYGSAAAIARAAEAVGVDFSAKMVQTARKRVPQGEFREADAQSLPFEDASFDAVICPFGVLHLPEPEQGIAEAFRVLKPGGRFAFTVWCTPEKVQFFELVLGAVQAHGTMDVPLPEAPPMFRFSEHDECRRVLENTGFVGIEISDIPLFYHPDSAEQLLDFTYKSAVRTPLVLELQTPEARERIHAAIVEGAKRFERQGRIEIAMPAVLASGKRP